MYALCREDAVKRAIDRYRIVHEVFMDPIALGLEELTRCRRLVLPPDFKQVGDSRTPTCLWCAIDRRAP